MAETGRNYLTGSIMLSRSEDGISPERYEIKSIVGEGGSSVCYEVTRALKNGFVETGKLKEFYPVCAVAGHPSGDFTLERLPSGQLVPCSGNVQTFNDMCRDFVSTYRLLQKVMVDNPKNEILKSFIQHGEILYGSTDATVYIWSPGLPGKGFDLYLQEVRKNPKVDSEKKLHDILRVMDALADSIKALHAAGLMHLDIKPSNFLIPYDSSFDIVPDRISLFDINTLCSIESDQLRVTGTKGFCAPEVARGRADNRSDIYSLGAMLFHAIVIAKDIPDGIYHDSYFADINQYVRHSDLVLASETNADATLMTYLCRILEKCLTRNPRNRYQSCSELKRDLDKAKYRLEKMLWAPSVSKSAHGLVDPVISMQKLLYEHPLYEALEKDAQELHVLMIGSGAYGQKFMDLCLELGQMSGLSLSITAVSDEAEEDKEVYLRFRPAISEFVNINGSVSDPDLAYAAVRFRNINEFCPERAGQIHFTGKMSQANRDIVHALLHDKKCFSYVFVSLGDDELNRSIACLLSDTLLGACPVGYVLQNHARCNETDMPQSVYPVCVNETIDFSAIDERLGDMAFNAHISWNTSLNIDWANERKRFFEGTTETDTYNRAASLAFAMSIPYKLHSVQITCTDFLDASGQFADQILNARCTSPAAKEKYDRLVDLEHRRWLINHAKDGWRAPRDAAGKLDLEGCVRRGSIKDPVHRTHPCMVRGSATSPLSTEKYTAHDHLLWNAGETDSQLDELDQASIEIHRYFMRYAKTFKKNVLLQNQDLTYIQQWLSVNSEEAISAFRIFREVLKHIVHGSERFSRQYKHYREVFVKSLTKLPKENRTKIEDRLALIDHTYFPLIESNLYRNYKAYDAVLIEKIPFILTYHHMPTLAIAFEAGSDDGGNEEIFSNVAAATVLCPQYMQYIYCFRTDSDTDRLIRRIDGIICYLNQRNMQTGISFAIVCMSDIQIAKKDELQEELSKLSSRYVKGTNSVWIDKIAIYEAAGYEEAANRLTEYLAAHPVDLYDGSNRLFPSAEANAYYSEKLKERHIPCYVYDWRRRVFSQTTGCEYLHYVQETPFIRIQDMMTLAGASARPVSPVEYAEDYEALWRIYTGEDTDVHRHEDRASAWKHLCICLQRYEEKQGPVIRLPLHQESAVSLNTQQYYLPEYTYDTVSYLIQRLTAYGIVDADSHVVMYAADTCKVELASSSEVAKALHILFAQPHLLLPYYGTTITKTGRGETGYVEIRQNQMSVTGVKLQAENSDDRSMQLDILKQLEREHFITQVYQEENEGTCVRFTYSSPRMKKLLTSPNELLKVYAYYEILKTGYFDDIACGYPFTWTAEETQHELDLVITKGFSSVFVTCGDGEDPVRDAKRFSRDVRRLGIGKVVVKLEDKEIMHLAERLKRLMTGTPPFLP